eukprot:COSAG06_NODE_64416_length_259_cov_1.181250_2_plen_56_part_01
MMRVTTRQFHHRTASVTASVIQLDGIAAAAALAVLAEPKAAVAAAAAAAARAASGK